jgi:hypothetical protein
MIERRGDEDVAADHGVGQLRAGCHHHGTLSGEFGREVGAERLLQ